MPSVMPPRTETRALTHYVAIAAKAPRAEIGATLPPLLPEVFGWLAANGIAPAGPPFFRYTDMSGSALSVDVGVPVGSQVAASVAGGGPVRPGTLPAGRYLSLTYLGDFSGVHQANVDLHQWAQEQGLAFQRLDAGGAHVEFYVTDPQTQPDQSKWVTQVSIRLAD